MVQAERSLNELYSDDPARADAVAFGRRTDASRRGFLGGAGLAAFGAAVGGAVPFSANFPSGLVPAALAQTPAAPATAAPKGPQFLDFPGKDKGLVLLGDKPLVAETPESLLNDDTTPIDKFFIRNNGITPTGFPEGDAWELKVDGEVNTPLSLKLGELKSKYKNVTRRMVLECGGNGRSFFTPAARGNQWTNGGVGCAEWTGILLRDVLKTAGIKSSAVYTGNYGADQHLSGDTSKDAISRGVPIASALEEYAMLVWGMNGQPLPTTHGGPLRLIIPGFPGSVSHKWIKRIAIRDKVHDGQSMGGTSYSTTINPMIPGGKVDNANMRTMLNMPVRAILSSPSNGTKLAAGTRKLALRGAAWAGHENVARVDVSIDFGATWTRVKALSKLRNRYDWNRWTADITLPSDGYYEIWVRATDSKGRAQPHLAGNWNPQGYGGNQMQRTAILVG